MVSALWNLIKALFGGLGLDGMLYSLLVLALAFSLFQWREARHALTLEHMRHNATRVALQGEITDLSTERGLLLLSQRSANATITGLQRQVNGTLAAGQKAVTAANDRTAILSQAQIAPSNPNDVVDHATTQRSIDHLNAAFGH